MRNDTRRGRGQWRGCYSFKGISSRDERPTYRPTRSGGLKMGGTYYYYYEVDGSIETYDPAQPSTTACPYLPGQTVNTLYVPVEQTLRHRSASVSSLRQESYMIMDPDGRFVTPVPPPTINGSPTIRRLGSASSLLYGRPTSQSGSVGPSWKRFFGWEANLKTERQATACISREVDISPFRFQLPDSTPHSMDERRTRDISPESLRRFLIDDPPLPPDPTMSYLSVLDIPTELAEEVDDEVDDDDDDSFATSAISETQVLRTRLSPPPCQRSVCTDLAPPSDTHSSSLTLTIRSTTDQRAIHDQTIDAPSDITQLPKLDAATDASQSNWSPTTSSSIFTTPISPQSLTDERSCFYDSNDDDDVLSSADGECLFYNPHQNMPIEEIFKGYSLPRHSGEDKAVDSSSPGKSGREPDMAISGMSFLCGPIDTGLDDFVSELGLIAEVIGSKHN